MSSSSSRIDYVPYDPMPRDADFRRHLGALAVYTLPWHQPPAMMQLYDCLEVSPPAMYPLLHDSVNIRVCGTSS
jgi:hypothetical protein